MVFRIENRDNLNDRCRMYNQLPTIPLADLEHYMATEIRKQINGTMDRKLFSCSRSLGVCLLRYNKYTDNELYIGDYDSYIGCVEYLVCKKKCLKYQTAYFDLMYGLYGVNDKDFNKNVVLNNFCVDVSDNEMVHNYLRRMTGVGKKYRASPEKDQEILVMQSTEELVISNYIDSIYLLYSLVIRYGMPDQLYVSLWNAFVCLDENRFYYCSMERHAIMSIVDYLHCCQKYEKYIFDEIKYQVLAKGHMSLYYDPICQLMDIQKFSFEESYCLSDYNDNIVSDLIWEHYAKWKER